MTQIPENAIKCLDKGFVRLVDSMGGDMVPWYRLGNAEVPVDAIGELECVEEEE